MQLVGCWPAESSSAAAWLAGLRSALHEPVPLSTGSAGIAGGALCSLLTMLSTKDSSLAADLDMASRALSPMPRRDWPGFWSVHTGFRTGLEV